MNKEGYIHVSGDQISLNTLGSLFKKYIVDPITKAEGHKAYADCIIRNVEGKILLLRRCSTDEFEPNKWSLPGGKVEAGELTSFAAQRELEEETGLRNLDITYLDSVVHKDKSISYYYQGVLGIGFYDDILLDTNEHYHYEWVDPLLIIDGLDKREFLLDLGMVLPNLLKKLPTLIVQRPSRQDIEATFVDGISEKMLLEAKNVFDNSIMGVQDYALFIQDFNEVKKNYLKKALDNGEITDGEYLIEKGLGRTAAMVGELRNFGGKEYIKTTNGWRANGKNGQEHTRGVLDHYMGEKKKADETENEKKKKTTELGEYAKNAPESALRKVIKEHGDPAMRLAAKQELKRREAEESVDEDADETNPFLKETSKKK